MRRARLLNVSPRTVLRWGTNQGLPSIRTLGGQRRYRWSDVTGWPGRRSRSGGSSPQPHSGRESTTPRTAAPFDATPTVKPFTFRPVTQRLTSRQREVSRSGVSRPRWNEKRDKRSPGQGRSPPCRKPDWRRCRGLSAPARCPSRGDFRPYPSAPAPKQSA